MNWESENAKSYWRKITKHIYNQKIYYIVAFYDTLIIISTVDKLSSNLIDVTELLAGKLNFVCSRIDDNGISVILHGEKSDYNLTVILKPDYEILYFSCDLSIHISDSAYNIITDAIVKANERIWIGHFDILSEDHDIVFSVTIPFISSIITDELIIESTLKIIINECDRFYNYFLMLSKNDASCNDMSIDEMFMEPLGEA